MGTWGSVGVVWRWYFLCVGSSVFPSIPLTAAPEVGVLVSVLYPCSQITKLVRDGFGVTGPTGPVSPQKRACPPVPAGVWAALRGSGARPHTGLCVFSVFCKLYTRCETVSPGGILVLFHVKFGTLQRALGLESEGLGPSYESPPHHLCDFGQDIELPEPLLNHQLTGAEGRASSFPL